MGHTEHWLAPLAGFCGQAVGAMSRRQAGDQIVTIGSVPTNPTADCHKVLHRPLRPPSPLLSTAMRGQPRPSLQVYHGETKATEKIVVKESFSSIFAQPVSMYIKVIFSVQATFKPLTFNWKNLFFLLIYLILSESLPSTLQRHNSENSKLIFPEKE